MIFLLWMTYTSSSSQMALSMEPEHYRPTPSCWTQDLGWYKDHIIDLVWPWFVQKSKTQYITSIITDTDVLLRGYCSHEPCITDQACICQIIWVYTNNIVTFLIIVVFALRTICSLYCDWPWTCSLNGQLAGHMSNFYVPSLLKA